MESVTRQCKANQSYQSFFKDRSFHDFSILNCREMMNSCTKAVIFNLQNNCFQFRVALFHFTPIIECKRQNFWDYVSLFLPKHTCTCMHECFYLQDLDHWFCDMGCVLFRMYLFGFQYF